MERKNKGKNLVCFPASYTIIDIETTGLSVDYDYIIELSAIRYRDGVETDRISSLIRPYDLSGVPVEICEFVEELTGITNTMLLNAPPIQDVLPSYLDFLGDDILVGHNVNFDINFLYDNFQEHLNTPLTNDYVDTMRISRLMHPEYPHHRLSDLSSRYGIDYSKAHRSLSDCEITHSCFCALLEEMLSNFGSAENFLSLRRPKKRKLNASDITSSVDTFDETHPLYQKVCVFTGTLEKMTRREAMQIVVDHGGTNGNSVTKKTNYLILGNNDYCTTIKGGKSSKQKKAEDLILAGADLLIIPENSFYEMISDSEKENL